MLGIGRLIGFDCKPAQRRPTGEQPLDRARVRPGQVLGESGQLAGHRLLVYHLVTARRVASTGPAASEDYKRAFFDDLSRGPNC